MFNIEETACTHADICVYDSRMILPRLHVFNGDRAFICFPVRCMYG
jgi:hypothetical protein